MSVMKERAGAFLLGYLECALWSSTDNSRDDGGDPLDRNYCIADLHDDCLATMEKDCLSFMARNQDDVFACDSMAQAGHDFWLTRNRHGAGFWDRGLGEVGNRLTAAAHAYGECDLYVGDDGMIHAS